MIVTMTTIAEYEELIERYNNAYKEGKISRNDRDINVAMFQHVIAIRKEEEETCRGLNLSARCMVSDMVMIREYYHQSPCMNKEFTARKHE